MQKPPDLLSELLLKTGVLSSPQLDTIYKEMEKWGGRLINLVVEMGLIPEESLAQLLSRELRLPVLKLNEMLNIPPHALERLPLVLCEKSDAIPLSYDNQRNILQIAISDPTDPHIFQELKAVSKASHIEAHIATTTSIRRAIQIYYYGESTGDAYQIVRELYPAQNTQGAYGPPQPSGTHYPAQGGLGFPNTSFQPGTRGPGFGPAPGSNPPIPGANSPIQGRVPFPAFPAPPSLSPGGISQPDYIAAPQEAMDPMSASPELTALRQRLGNIEQSLVRMQKEAEEKEKRHKAEIAGIHELMRERLQEQRLLLRGVLDMLVTRGTIQKDDVMKILDSVTQKK